MIVFDNLTKETLKCFITNCFIVIETDKFTYLLEPLIFQLVQPKLSASVFAGFLHQLL